MHDEKKVYTEDIRTAIVEKYIQSERFNQYFEGLKQKKLAAGDISWINASPPSPSVTELAKAVSKKGICSQEQFCGEFD